MASLLSLLLLSPFPLLYASLVAFPFRIEILTHPFIPTSELQAGQSVRMGWKHRVLTHPTLIPLIPTAPGHSGAGDVENRPLASSAALKKGGPLTNGDNRAVTPGAFLPLSCRFRVSAA